MRYSNEKTGFYAAILFLVWPMLAVVSAFKNNRSNWAKNIVWAFVAFYGFSFAIGAENSGSDIVRYVAEMKDLHSMEMTIADAESYFLQSGELDVLRTLIALVTSRITDLQAVLTLIYGIIFGFFYSRNMWYVMERLRGKKKPITILLLSCFFLIVPIWYLNGFRFWTATHIFLYGLLPFLFEGKKKGIFFSLSAILVHYTFIIPVGILFGYLLVGNRLTVYFAFFLLTFFVSEINLQTFNSIIENYTPEVVQERTSSYRSEEKVKEARDGPDKKLNWYVLLYVRALKWSVMGFLVVLFFRGRPFFRAHKRYLSLFCFTLLFYGVANLFSSLPSGARFVTVANLVALALIIFYLQDCEKDIVMERFIWFATPALLLFVVVTIRTGLYSVSATALLGNPILALFLTGDFMSLNDFMKAIL